MSRNAASVAMVMAASVAYVRRFSFLSDGLFRRKTKLYWSLFLLSSKPESIEKNGKFIWRNTWVAGLRIYEFAFVFSRRTWLQWLSCSLWFIFKIVSPRQCPMPIPNIVWYFSPSDRQRLSFVVSRCYNDTKDHKTFLKWHAKVRILEEI